MLVSTALLLAAVAAVRGMPESFQLLDRERRLVRTHKLLLGAVAVTVACTALVLALALLRGPGAVPDPGPAAVAPAQSPAAPRLMQELSVPASPIAEPSGDPAEDGEGASAPVVPNEDAAPEPEPEPEAVPQPAAVEPAPAAEVAPEAAAPGGNWRLARIVSGGQVTLRAWPNGTEEAMLSPGDRVLTREEIQHAGGHAWERIRLPDGRSGWVVERFVQPDR